MRVLLGLGYGVQVPEFRPRIFRANACKEGHLLVEIKGWGAAKKSDCPGVDFQVLVLVHMQVSCVACSYPDPAT